MLPSTKVHLMAALAQAQADDRLPSVVAAVLRDGELAWSAGRGRCVRRDGTERPDADTQYRIGSITKTFVAALVLQLRDEGRLDLNDPVGTHVPEGPYPDRSLRSLLTHTSGMQAEPNGPWWERAPGPDYGTLAAANPASGAVLPDGQQHHYSNVGFAVLGEVVARLRRCSWEQALRQWVLEPLGMARTTYTPHPPAAEGLSVDAWAGTLTPEPVHDSGAMAPAGQLWSTAADLTRWMRALVDPPEAVLSRGSLREMTTVHSALPDDALTGGYGLDTEGLPRRLIDAVLEHEPAPAPEWRPTESVPAHLRELLGVWHWGHMPFLMRTDGADLTLQATSGGRSFHFRSTGEDAYIGLSGYHAGETLRVVRHADGSISHLDLATFVYTRIPYDPRADVPAWHGPGGR